MFNSLRYKLIQFMSGRYGSDTLNNYLFVLYFIVWVLNAIIWSNVISLILDIIQLSLILLIFYRMLSKNIYKRQKENNDFLRIFGKYLPDWKLIANMHRDRNTHVYKKCPNCKAVLRLKKIKGEHTARCPKCSSQVKVKVR